MMHVGGSFQKPLLTALYTNEYHLDSLIVRMCVTFDSIYGFPLSNVSLLGKRGKVGWDE